MPKLIMTKGLPGSGKSTWAKQQNAFRINKDDLRTMMNNGIWSKTNEAYILLVRNLIAELHLKDGNDVIIDDTNLAPKHEATLKEIAKKHGAEFIIQDFTDVPLEECIKRDQKRPNYAGEKVIKNMYKQWIQKKAEPVSWDKTLETAIICDLDGTLALFGDANPYERDFNQDQVNEAIRVILQEFDRYHIILVSGRNDKFKEVTESWLHNIACVPYHELHMRKEGDVRKDNVVKQEIYDQFVKGKFNVLFILDDRNQVVDFWRSQGLTCFQVAEGDF